MNIDLLIKMANQISAFWITEAGPEKAPAEVATHLRRYWDPRMREQMVAHYEARQGAGLDDIARGAVGILNEEAKVKARARAGTPPAA
jgi:formate dehydrogenase subunit delta